MAKTPARETPPDPKVAKTGVNTSDVQSRLTLPLTSSGGLDVSRMRDDTRDKLKKALADRSVTAALGVDPPALPSASGPPDVFDAQWSGVLFDAIGELEIAIAQRVYKCSEEQARVLAYSEQDKRLLAAPLAKVLNKYAGPALVKYQDEVALLVLWGSITAGKLTMLRRSLTGDVTPVLDTPQHGSQEQKH